MCNACGTKAQLDHTHKAGKQLIKDIPNMKGTEFGKNLAAKGQSVKEQQLAETTAQENEPEKPKKPKKLTEEQKAERAQEIQNKIETGEEINEIDAEELALDSEDISKYLFLDGGFQRETMSSNIVLSLPMILCDYKTQARFCNSDTPLKPSNAPIINVISSGPNV